MDILKIYKLLQVFLRDKVEYMVLIKVLKIKKEKIVKLLFNREWRKDKFKRWMKIEEDNKRL